MFGLTKVNKYRLLALLCLALAVLTLFIEMEFAYGNSMYSVAFILFCVLFYFFVFLTRRERMKNKRKN